MGAEGRRGRVGAGRVTRHGIAASPDNPPQRSQRWRHAFQDSGQDSGERPEPELEPLLPVEVLRDRWDTEWSAVDAWLPNVTDGFVDHIHEGVPVWQMLVHVVNHGTQHRAEAAALLTAEGRSPGELDLFDFAEEQAEPSDH